MELLVVGATALELGPAIDYFRTNRFRGSDSVPETGITGVGILACSYFLMDRIRTRRPDCILQAGIAGGYSGAKPGNVYAVREEILVDTGVQEGNDFKTVSEMGLVPPDEFPFRDGRLANPHKALLSLSGLEEVRAGTVHEITTDSRRISGYQERQQIRLESMEGAALHFVCLREKIPFLQIRAVSNQVGERDKRQWCIPEAVARLNQVLLRVVADLTGRDKNLFYET
jgi:futalosine hydrolase